MPFTINFDNIKFEIFETEFDFNYAILNYTDGSGAYELVNVINSVAWLKSK